MNKNTLIISLIIASIIFLIFVFPIGDNGQEQEEAVTEEEIIINEEGYMDYIITIKTNKGDMEFKTYAQDAPNTVANFVKLANDGFYDGVIFHRVIDGFMIQGGDPTGTGRGGPGYVFDDEINPNSKIYQEGYKKGIVAMANAGPNTQGSQFFIMVADHPLLSSYTIFGKITSGQEVADAISLVERDDSDKPLEDVIIETVLIAEDNENR